MKEKTPWEKKLEKSKKPLGFITKVGAFKDPTPAELAACIEIERKSWQDSKGQSTFTISAPYSVPRGHGINLKSDRDAFEPIKGAKREEAIKAYVETKLDDKDETLKKQKIDVAPYEQPPTMIDKFLDWFNRSIYKFRKGPMMGRYSYMELQELMKESEENK